MTNHELKETLITIGIWVLVISGAIFGLICVGWTIYAFAKYGNQPITEIPSWALWFMFGGNK